MGQRVWIQVRPDMLMSLVWVQADCKGYQQTSLTVYTITHSEFDPFTDVYNAHNTPGDNTAILMLLWCYSLHIISNKIIITVGIYIKYFPACLKHLVQCLK